jgi:tRNA dimethylallyltransferase
MEERRPILIAGPTASGKSALALRLARERGGVVINADSMQVYSDLRILTARPMPEEEEQAPHRLYGHVAANDAYSVARWLADVGEVLETTAREGRTPIIVGGTGLYFKALTEGLSPIPEIAGEIRRRWRQQAEAAGEGELHRLLQARDPAMAKRLAPGDTQRLTRALEVLDATGRSLAEWQEMPGRPLLRVEAADCIVVRMPREELRDRCDRRFDAMIAAGALDEVAALVSKRLAADLPAMRALGVTPLAAHIAGETSLEAAVARAKSETHQYVKRQETWLKRNMNTWKTYTTK